MADAWSDASQQVSILCDGWHERREYSVTGDTGTEVRVERYWHPPLLVQLRTLTQPLIRAKEEGGSSGKPGSKPPGAFEAAALLDEIGRYAHDVQAQWNGEQRRTLRTTVGRALLVLRESSHMRTSEEVRELSWHLAAFVRRARIIVGHDVATRAFANTVCGECGGELRAPVDGAGPVFCAGTPSTGPCGTEYGSWDVIRLAMALEVSSDPETSGFGTGSDLLDDAAPAG